MILLIAIAVLLLLLASAAYVYTTSSQASTKATTSDSKGGGTGTKDGKQMPGTGVQGSIGPVPMEDFVKLFNRFTPYSTHMDILLAVLAMDDVLDKATHELLKIHELREKRKKQIEEEENEKAKNKNKIDFTDLVDDDGWGDDDDEDANDDGVNAAKKAKEEEQRKAEELARLRKATGKTLPPLEGLDKGVLGQEWVEGTLTESGAWPPKLGALGEETFDYKDPGSSRTKKLKPLDHPAFRRCLCMTMGRLHSADLNAHPELVKAGVNKLVDETYFKGALEFRQRVGLILDAALRIALTIQSYPLFGTLVETLAAFKVGCMPKDPKSLPWFNGNMARQYNTLPRLEIGKITFEAPREEGSAPNNANEEDQTPPTTLTELVAGQRAVVVLPVDRTHAENFTKVKVAQCQAQNIPPQIALQGYREAWWFLAKWEPTSKDVELSVDEIPRKFIEQLDPAVMKRFDETSPNHRVRTAFPMIVQNIQQKAGTVKVGITAPKNAGMYKVTVAVKSQDFLGADQELTLEIKVVENAEDSADTEPKKDK